MSVILAPFRLMDLAVSQKLVRDSPRSYQSRHYNPSTKDYFENAVRNMGWDAFAQSLPAEGKPSGTNFLGSILQSTTRKPPRENWGMSFFPSFESVSLFCPSYQGSTTHPLLIRLACGSALPSPYVSPLRSQLTLYNHCILRPHKSQGRQTVQDCRERD